jgi:hypothetical protein
VCLVDAADHRVGRGQLAEAPAQVHLAVVVEALVAEEQHLAFDKRGAQGHDVVVGGAGQVQAVHDGAEVRAERFQLQPHECCGHAGLPSR